MGSVDETVLGPEIVQRNPPPSVVSQIIAEPNFTNQTGGPLNPFSGCREHYFTISEIYLSSIRAASIFNFSFITNARLGTLRPG